MKYATIDHNQDATFYHILQDVPPREEPFIKAPTLKDPSEKKTKAPKENILIFAPKRKLRLLCSFRILKTNSICQAARSPTPLLLPLLLRLTLRCSILRRRTRSSPGYEPAPCRFLPSAHWPSSQVATVPTLDTTTIDTTTWSGSSTTPIPLLTVLPATTTVLATMLPLTLSSQH